jgi:hypothetical protein
MNATRASDEHLLLLGYPPAAEFFRVVRTLAPGGESRSGEEMAGAWLRSNQRVQALQQLEPDLAAVHTLTDLPSSIAEVAATCLQDTALANAQRIAPRRWAMVELDRLMVSQKHINLEWARRLDAQIGDRLTDTDLVRLAAGAGMPAPSVELTRSDDSTFTFSSRSGELRFLGTRSLGTELMSTESMTGRATHVIGVMIGFGLTCMGALHYRDRLILTNGMHRAYVLRRRGMTHAPCLVISARHEDELDLNGLAEGRARFERFLRMARPPLLKDYFDPVLCERTTLFRHSRAIQFQITPRTFRIPACAE